MILKILPNYFCSTGTGRVAEEAESGTRRVVQRPREHVLRGNISGSGGRPMRELSALLDGNGNWY